MLPYRVHDGVKIGTDLTSTSATGVSEDYFSIKGYTLSQGRGLQYSDIASRSKVCVVGAYVNQAYFGGQRRGGRALRGRGQALTIVGVLDQQAETMEEGGSDDCLFLPYSTAARLGGGRVSQLCHHHGGRESDGRQPGCPGIGPAQLFRQ